MSAPLSIGDRTIGDGAPCYVIAEAGSNHNGSFELACRLIEIAATAGADAVKFQVFRASRLYPRSAGRSDYLGLPTSIYDVIERMETPYEWLPRLAERCHNHGVAFLASAFDEASADEVDPYVEMHKIASYEMTHLPLLRHVAAKGKPMILSTGTATLDEVGETVSALAATGSPGFVLMQCTAAYPAPFDSLQLRAIETMRDAFAVPVGFSDHSRDPVVAPVAAVVLGAAVLEKHFTVSNELPGPDHRFALEPHELERMVRSVRDAELALGDGRKAVETVELELRDFARRSIFAITPIAAGEPFTKDNVAALRNGKLQHGLSPRDLPAILGRHAARSLLPDSPVAATDVA
jgi:N,N'-diacetyllegionaminate synthase